MTETFFEDQAATIYCGHALDILKQLPDESVQMCMTSPPYYGLRNYAGGEDIVWADDENCEHDWAEGTQGLQHENRPNLSGSREEVAGRTGTTFIQKYDRLPAAFCIKCGAWRGQLGLEPAPDLYVGHLMMIFREVKRVLRKDGSFYLNIGDTYAGSWADAGHRPERTGVDGQQREKRTSWLERKGQPQMNIPPQRQALRLTGIQPKCMFCIPERVMFAMLGDSWILRNKIIWKKPNAMPGSQKDRLTATWEYIYFFTKARKYYYDLDAIRVPHTTQSLERYQRGVNLGRPAEGKSGEVGPFQQYTRALEWFKEMFPRDGDYKGKFDDLFGHGPNPQSFNLRVHDVKCGNKGTSAQGGDLKASDKELEEYDYPEKHHGSSMSNQEGLHTDRARHGFGAKAHGGMKTNIVRPEDGPEPHAFHPKGKNPGDYCELTTKPSSICVCPQCESVFARYKKVCPDCKIEGVVGHFAPYPEELCHMPIRASSRIGDILLDPFAGAGNTGIAAKRLGRKTILIDCVREYCIMARYKLQRVGYQAELK